MTIAIVVAIITALGYWFFEIKKPKNTDWQRCMHHCDTVYPQHGLHPSVYDCPKCGERTNYAVYKYTDGELEVKMK